MSKRPSRIAILAPHFAEYSERLAAGLAVHGPTLLILNTHDRKAHIERPIPSAARVFAVPMNRRHEQAFTVLFVLAQLLVFRPDLVIIQEGTRPLLKAIVRVLKGRRKLALIVHDPEPHSGGDSALGGLPFRRWLRQTCDLLIVHGASCRSAMVRLGYEPARIVTINHGVLMVPDRPTTIAPEPGRVLQFGRMEAYKGVEVLLDAVGKLNARGIPLHLVVAGAGPEQARLRSRMAALGTVEAIDRYLTPDELETQLARASFSVAPYLDATQSGVLASTFGNGRPAIASDVGGLGDVVKPGINGLLVPPGDAGALADAMASLLGDPALVDRLAEGARRFAATDLDWTHIAGGLLDAVAARG